MRCLFLLTAATLLAACTPAAQAQLPATTRSPYGLPRYNDPLGITYYDPVEAMRNRHFGRTPYSGPGIGSRPYDPLSRYDPLGGHGFANPPFGSSYPGVTTTQDRSPFRGIRQQREDEERRGSINTLVPHVPFPHSGTGVTKMPTPQYSPPSYKIPSPELKLPEYKSPLKPSSFPWWLSGSLAAGVSGIAALFRSLLNRHQTE